MREEDNKYYPTLEPNHLAVKTSAQQLAMGHLHNPSKKVYFNDLGLVFTAR